jgi:hypothetical protein
MRSSQVVTGLLATLCITDLRLKAMLHGIPAIPGGPRFQCGYGLLEEALAREVDKRREKVKKMRANTVPTTVTRAGIRRQEKSRPLDMCGISSISCWY